MKIILLFLLFSILTQFTFAKDLLTGKVVKISDGDTINILTK